MRPQADTYRSDIDGLRAVAVLLVVLYHAAVPGMRGGFIGVDVFFVISGYLITGLLKREIETAGRLDVLNFYARRARRLLPAAGLVLLATLALANFLLSPLEMLRLVKPAMATATYTSNIWFILQGGDYFAGDMRENPFLHTWSLSVEEQFYLLWPLVVFLSIRKARGRGLMAPLTILSLGSFILSLWLAGARPLWAFYGTPARIWEFGAGALVLAFPAWPDPYRKFIGALGFAVILISSCLFSPRTSYPGYAILPVLGTAAILSSGLRILSTPALTALGRVSYSWYLWHWPLLTLSAAVWPGYTVGWRLLVAFGALPLAVVTTRFVEKPIRFNAYLSRRKGLSLSIAAGAILLILAIAGGARQAYVADMNSPSQRRFIAAASERTKLAASCLAKPGDQILICKFGDADSPVNVVLFGDSHAEELFPAIEQLARQRGWRVTTLVRASCPAVNVPIFNDVLKGIDAECGRWWQQAQAAIQSMHPWAVIICQSSGYDVSARAWEEGMRRTLQTLRPSASHLIVVRDPPHPDLDIPVCLSRAARSDALAPETHCIVQRSAALSGGFWNAERDAAKTVPGVTLVDLSDEFCGTDTCPAIIRGLVVYRDTNHISTQFAPVLTPALMGQIPDNP